MNKIKKIFSFIKELILSGFSVFMIGEDYEGIDVLSVEEHVKKVEPLQCQCRKCFLYYYLRTKKLEKENIELRDRWIRIFGNYNEQKKVIETYKTFSDKGVEVNDGYL